MNEQLIVKNFGPIKDATVDFKRVTVFIGPTGGGKSTLAKLAAVFREEEFYDEIKTAFKDRASFSKFLIKGFFTDSTSFKYASAFSEVKYADGEHSINLTETKTQEVGIFFDEVRALLKDIQNSTNIDKAEAANLPLVELTQKENKSRAYVHALLERLENEKFSKYAVPVKLEYIPAERIFVPSIEYSWAGLMRDDIGLPKTLLEFANNFSLSRKNVFELEIPFLSIKYLHIEGKDFIKIPEREEPLMLLEAASGIQSVTPLLVLLEHLRRNTEQAKSFIIEEPELNLYPIAQQGLLNWLVEKCTQGENDLTITTHSPYILSHLNLLLYAHQVAEKHPDRKEAVAAIVPEASWINPKEFACYHVGDGSVKSLIDEELGLIDNNELDNISGDKADAFDRLISINRGFIHA